MLWRRRYRLPRKVRSTRIVRRISNGRLYAVHHGGYASMVTSLFGSGPKFWFLPVRKWRGKFVAAIDLVWQPEPCEFAVIDGERRILYVGRKVARSIDDGGLT